MARYKQSNFPMIAFLLIKWKYSPVLVHNLYPMLWNNIHKTSYQVPVITYCRYKVILSSSSQFYFLFLKKTCSFSCYWETADCTAVCPEDFPGRKFKETEMNRETISFKLMTNWQCVNLLILVLNNAACPLYKLLWFSCYYRNRMS